MAFMNCDILYQIAVWLIPLIIAIVFHEVAHGVVARRLGDPTAQQHGRLTLNPIRHVEPFGTIVLPLILAISHAPIFGWAKPVPVNYRSLLRPRRDMILVALAGPGMNLLLALGGTLVLAVTLIVADGAKAGVPMFIAANALNFMFINIFLAVFNLLPVPPFDGGHVVEGLLPRPLARQFKKIGRFSLLVFVALLLVLPAISPSADVMRQVISPIAEAIARTLLGLFHIVL
jgi:Zn-dependent protease